MRRITTILFLSVFLMCFGGVFAQTFNKSTDLLLANYDFLPDDDDVHSAAALACMLKHEDFVGVNYYAVAGAYGVQDKNGVPYTFINTVTPDFFNTLFGEENSKWTDADGDWSGSVTRVTAEVVNVLNAGGNVFVQEGGQSDFTYDVCQAAIAAGVTAAKVKTNVIVIQHSNYNMNNTGEPAKTWIKANTAYKLIADCNNAGNGTPAYKDTATKWMTAAKASTNPNGFAQVYWTMADKICDDWTVYNNTAIAGGGVDFSDCGENWEIFGWGTQNMTVSDFWDKFITNDIDADFAPVVRFVTPALTSITIPESDTTANIAPVQISATDDGSISYVELYLDDSLISKKTTAPYAWTTDEVLKNKSEGIYNLKAIAQDNTGNQGTALLTITVLAKGAAIPTGDHWISCEAENTTSPLGDWKLVKKGDAGYATGASGDQYLEFTANSASGTGSARSPLTYTFVCPKTATYELLIRYHQNLVNPSGGTYPVDYCNDCYISMAGDFTSGYANLSTEQLKTEQKFFGKGNNWGVGYRVTMYIGGKELNYPCRYNLTAGEEYTFTIAGRSNQTCVDYWLLFDNSEITDVPKAQTDMYTALDAKYHPGPVGDPVPVTGVSLPATAEIKSLGLTTQLDATFEPSTATVKTVIWSSSDDSVATVSQDGLVRAIGKGTATITVTTDDGAFTDSCIVTILDEALPEPEITGYYHITKNTFCLYAGDDNRAAGDPVTLQTLVQGDESMTWVENKRPDGYYYYQLKGTDFCMDAGDGGARSQAVVISAFDIENKNQHWSKDSISESVYRLIKRDVLFAIDAGATSAAVDGKPITLWISTVASANMHWTFIDATEETSSINEEAAQDVNIYPNPASDFITITTVKEMSRVDVFSIDGQLVSSQCVSGASLELDLPQVGPSLLFVNVELKDGNVSIQKIIVE